MKVKQLKVACISDIHLGHRKTKTEETLNSLRLMFPDNEETGELDIIFIAGDVFDRLLVLPDPNVFLIKQWIIHFLGVCKKRDIVVRVLEGTPSHDWKQSSLFTTFNSLGGIDCDLKYYDYLTIEFIDRFGISVAYIPDEWRTNTDDTYKELVKALKDNSLDKVDFIVMHGSFEYQLPPHVNQPKHNSDRYNSLVNHCCFVGHIHKHSINGKIIAQGSFNRIAHGEEEPKGHVRVTITNNNKEIVFVPTINSKVYKTIECIGEDIETTLSFIENQIKGLPLDSHIRIAASKSNPIFSSMELLTKRYPMFNITVKPTDVKHITQQTLIDMKQAYQPISINKANIEGLLIDRIKDKIEPELLERARRLIDGATA